MPTNINSTKKCTTKNNTEEEKTGRIYIDATDFVSFKERIDRCNEIKYTNEINNILQAISELENEIIYVKKFSFRINLIFGVLLLLLLLKVI